MNQRYPILEFDPDRKAVIEPVKIVKNRDHMPEHYVFCFFQDMIEILKNEKKIIEINSLGSEIGKNPIYRFNDVEPDIALLHPGVGAPLAAAFLEEAIALGGRKFIVCGGAGSIDRSQHIGDVIVPIAAIRDEGTSYHYLPPGEEVTPTKYALEAIINTLGEEKLSFKTAKTWTTDGVYRETKTKIQKRIKDGCTCVEMEAAALFAVARFRNVELAQLLYAGDDLSGDTWDSRNWDRKVKVRKKLLDLSINACKKL
jgi:uridine phosphorylase